MTRLRCIVEKINVNAADRKKPVAPGVKRENVNEIIIFCYFFFSLPIFGARVARAHERSDCADSFAINLRCCS